MSSGTPWLITEEAQRPPNTCHATHHQTGFVFAVGPAACWRVRQCGQRASTQVSAGRFGTPMETQYPATLTTFQTVVKGSVLAKPTLNQSRQGRGTKAKSEAQDAAERDHAQGSLTSVLFADQCAVCSFPSQVKLTVSVKCFCGTK